MFFKFSCNNQVNAVLEKGCAEIAVVGGVAANSRLRERVLLDAGVKELKVHIPPIALCGDNAAMIAAAGYHHLRKGTTTALNGDVYSRTGASMI